MKSKEINSLKKLIELLESNGSLGINIGHVIEDVRVNGWQRKVSILDVYKSTQELKRTLKLKRMSIIQDERIIFKILGMFKKYKICPNCNGEKGTLYEKYNPHQHWEDCFFCKGIGLTLK